jgi:hypothetical protein
MTGALDRKAHGEECRRHASDARAHASKTADPEVKQQWSMLTLQYEALAQQWEQNRL